MTLTGTYCINGELTKCPDHTTSTDLSSTVSDCVPVQGYETNSATGAVAACGVGEFKPTVGDVACSLCTAGASTSGLGSTSEFDCLCSDGYFGPAGGPCVVCDIGYWCASGVENACPGNASTATTGKSVKSDCVCNPGLETHAGVSVRVGIMMQRMFVCRVSRRNQNA